MMIKKNKNILLILLTLVSMIGCASEQPKSTGPTDEEIVARLNKELAALEIQGFGDDQTTLPESHYKKWSGKGVEGIKKVIPEIPNGYKLAVTGHADPDGGEARANQVAQGRADHIKGKIVKILGVEPSKISTKNYGTQKFSQKKDSSISRNRRVEFEVVKG